MRFFKQQEKECHPVESWVVLPKGRSKRLLNPEQLASYACDSLYAVREQTWYVYPNFMTRRITLTASKSGVKWWVDSDGCGQLLDTEPPQSWPKSRHPVIYAHFCTDFTDENCPPNLGVTPKFKPHQLVYIGERSSLKNFRRGPKGYKWLKLGEGDVLTGEGGFRGSFKESWMYSIYWELDYDQPVDSDDRLWRITLEAGVYYDLASKFASTPGVLRCVEGMQFRHIYFHDKVLKKMRSKIVEDILSYFR